MKRAARIITLIFGWIIIGIIAVFLIAYLLIQIPSVQNYAKDKAVVYLQNKLQTTVAVGNISIDFPKKVVLENVLINDRSNALLLSGKKLAVNISVFKLFRNIVEINYLELDGIKANIYRKGPDSTFNFQFIIDAFASDKPVDTSAAPMLISLDRIELKNISGNFLDDQSGNDVSFIINKLSSKIDEFKTNELKYSIPLVFIDGLKANVHQYKPLVSEVEPQVVVEQKSDEPASFDLKLSTVDLNNITFTYNNDISAVETGLHIGTLSAAVKQMSLPETLVVLDELTLKNATGKLLLEKSVQSQKVSEQAKKEVKAQVNNPWRIYANKLNLNNNNFTFDNNNENRASRGFDYAHFNIKQFLLDAQDVELTPSAIKGAVGKLSFTETKSAFTLQQLQTNFVYNDSTITLNDLYLKTPQTVLRDKLSVTYPSLETFSKNIGELNIDARINQSIIGINDLMTFVPTLYSQTPFRQNRGGVLKINTQITGKLNDISIPYFQFSGFSGTTADASLTIKGLPQAQKAVYALMVHKITTNKKDIESLLPPSALPGDIRIPESYRLSGRFDGSVASYKTSFNVNTNRGSVTGLATVTNSGKTYQAKINTAEMDLGYILKDEKTYGRVSLFANVAGSGFDIKTMNAFADVNIRSAVYNHYNYNNVKAVTEIRNGKADFNIYSNDPNASFTASGILNLKGKKPSGDIELHARNIDLKALHFSKDPLSFKADVNAKIDDLDIDHPNGTVYISNALIKQKDQNFLIDSITIAAVSNSLENTLTVQSAFLNASLKGQYRLTEVGQAVMQTINRYYAIPGFKPRSIVPQQWDLQMQLFASPVVKKILPEITGTDSVYVNASFNSSNNDLQLNVKAPRIVYGKQVLDSINFNLSTQTDALVFNASTRSLKMPSLNLYQTRLNGSVANNQVHVSADVNDAKGNLQYHVMADAMEIPNGIKVSLDPGSLVLNYDKWVVSGDNYIEYTKDGIIVNNLVMSQGNQSLSINSSGAGYKAPIHINFNNFDIKTIARLANQDTLMASGLINGEAVVKDVLGKPSLTADLDIKDLLYMQDTVGNVDVVVKNATSDVLDGRITVSGKNEFTVEGNYFVESGEVDMDLNVQKIDLALLKTLGKTNIMDAGGTMAGSATIEGKITAPEIMGNFTFKDAFIAPAILGERFQIPSEGFTITPAGIELDRFTLKDSIGNTAVIDGYVFTSDFKDYAFDLSIAANNFRVVNAKKSPNQMFYGKLTIDSDMDITGTMESPVVDGYVLVKESTDFSYILPGANPEVQARKGVVNFVKIDSLRRDTVLLSMNPDSMSRYADLKGLDVYLDIETDTAAQLALVIDERNGDILKMRGNADLAMSIDKSGKLSLAGTYQLNSGSYDISLNFLRRHFEIVPGSQITWTGDPTTGLIKLDAVYIANAPSLDLVQPQMVGRSPAEVNRYKQRLPFHVKLNITGELLKPAIQFDIDLPEKQAAQWNEVEKKLTEIRRDQSELNKQVFALLLLNRFVGENPFETTSGGDNSAVESLARQSVSRLLSEQLNKLTANLIPGLDINVGVQSYEDYSTGEHQNRSDLTVKVSKKLLDDRLKVNVGSNFQVEGNANKNQQRNNVLGDVSLDYQLSADGRYMIRAYRTNAYEAVVEGQVIETGVSFIYTLDFEEFKDLFMGKSKAENRRNKRKNLRK